MENVQDIYRDVDWNRAYCLGFKNTEAHCRLRPGDCVCLYAVTRQIPSYSGVLSCVTEEYNLCVHTQFSQTSQSYGNAEILYLSEQFSGIVSGTAYILSR
jgi:hypothetical protein